MIYTLPSAIKGKFLGSHDPPYLEGDKATLQCDDGYRSNTIFSILTKKDDELVWNPSSVECFPRSCGAPPVIENGYHTGSVYSFPSMVTYKCFEGFKLKTLYKSLFCSATGEWIPSVKKIECEPIQCEELDNPENGSVSYPNRNVDSVATVVCNPGFYAVGSNKRICQTNGQWSGPEIICDPCPIIPNARIISPGFAAVKCDGKEVLVRCKADGTWTNPNCPENNSQLPIANPVSPSLPILQPNPVSPGLPILQPNSQIPNPVSSSLSTLRRRSYEWIISAIGLIASFILFIITL